MTALLASCNNASSKFGGAKHPIDEADSCARAAEILKEKVDTTKFRSISLSAIDPAAIGRQIEEAKQLLPEEA